MVVPYRNFKVHQLLSKGRHAIIEAELVLSNALSREDEITLSFLCSFQDHLVAGPGHGVINIEGAARLNLSQEKHRQDPHQDVKVNNIAVLTAK